MSRLRKNSGKFKAKMALAAAAVLRSSTLEEAALSVRISTATLKRWRQEPEFTRALRQGQQEIFLAMTNTLRQAGRSCAEVLTQIALDEKAPTPSRVRAAMAVLKLLLDLNELDDIQVDITQIKLALERKGIRVI